jgi:hypothetical protein
MDIMDIKRFIKNNSKIISYNIEYPDDGNIIYAYILNISGTNHSVKFIVNEENEIKTMLYNSDEITGNNDIQLELFDLLNYKNMEYIDCYILKKNNNKSFEIVDIYDDYYDNNEDILICNRTFIKNDIVIKLKIIYQNEDYILYNNMDTIYGFDNIIKKIDELFQ